MPNLGTGETVSTICPSGVADSSLVDVSTLQNARRMTERIESDAKVMLTFTTKGYLVAIEHRSGRGENADELKM